MEENEMKLLDLKGLSLVLGNIKLPGRGVQSPDIDRICVMDRVDYLALEVKDPRTAYLLRG